MTRPAVNCPPPCCGQPLDSVLLRVHFFPSLSPLRHFERPEVKSWETQPRMVTLQLSFEQYSPSLRQLIQTSKVSESVLQTKPFLKSNIEVLETWRLFVTVDYNTYSDPRWHQRGLYHFRDWKAPLLQYIQQVIKTKI